MLTALTKITSLPSKYTIRPILYCENKLGSFLLSFVRLSFFSQIFTLTFLFVPPKSFRYGNDFIRSRKLVRVRNEKVDVFSGWFKEAVCGEYFSLSSSCICSYRVGLWHILEKNRCSLNVMMMVACMYTHFYKKLFIKKCKKIYNYIYNNISLLS